jgi:hypothetical protein
MNLLMNCIKKLLPLSFKIFVRNNIINRIRLHRNCTVVDIEPIYCKETPSNQTIRDIFKGIWFTCLPEQYGTLAEPGQVHHFDASVDPRPKWVSEIRNNGLTHCSILELGPYEAYNTWQLEQLGAKEIISIEANNLSYLKCLMVKEITGMKARFLHGDFVRYLENCDRRFDIIWASGVLYHQEQPLHLLSLIANATDSLFLWTMYYDEEQIKARPDIAAFFSSGKVVLDEADGYKAKLYYREYNQAKGGIFSGGAEPFSYWMEKDDILGFLKHRGFNKINTSLSPDYVNGPALFLFAER